MSLEEQKIGFGDFLLDAKEKVLQRGGKPLPITPKALELLLVLVENHGHLVEKNELMRAVWADSFVEEGNLSFNIRQLRKVLGDDAQKPLYIETVPKRGYRFIAEVRKNPDAFLNDARRGPEVSHFPTSRTYVLITISAILMSGLLAAAFMWFGGRATDFAVQTTNRLTGNGKVTIAAVSPDGKTLVFARKEATGESLWQRAAATGSETQILPPAAVEFIGLTVSPAGDYAYYSVFTKNAVNLTLSRISLRGGASESLSEIASDVSVSFSPDGKNFAYTESHSSRRETLLRTARADGSNPKTILTLKGEARVLPVFRVRPIAWSFDGSEIACAVQETNADGAFFRILLVNPKDGSEKYLSEQRWNYVENLVWKDNENLVITDWEPSFPGSKIWLISRKTGEARQLGRDFKSYGSLTAANGNIFAVEKNTHSSIYIADLSEDFKTPQTKQIFNEPGVVEYLAWSASNKIFYNSWTSGKNDIWHINPDGTMPVQLTENSNLMMGFTVSPVDEKLVFASLQNGRSSLFLADADGRNVRRLTNGSNDSLPRFTPDGKEVIFQQGSLIKPTLWRISLDKNQPPKQFTGFYAHQPSVSPDGKTIAYQFMDFNSDDKVWRLALMNSADGRLLNKIDFPLPISERKVVWHPDGKLLTMVFQNGENSGFLLLSAEDNSYQTVENVTKGKISAFAWSPDGRRLAFAENQETSDAVLLDGPEIVNSNRE
jgi:DNA-binding winged helix-turn-helix (wHTH) protein/Tol biopolymer transport system component